MKLSDKLRIRAAAFPELKVTARFLSRAADALDASDTRLAKLEDTSRERFERIKKDYDDVYDDRARLRRRVQMLRAELASISEKLRL